MNMNIKTTYLMSTLSCETAKEKSQRWAPLVAHGEQQLYRLVVQLMGIFSNLTLTLS